MGDSHSGLAAAHLSIAICKREDTRNCRPVSLERKTSYKRVWEAFVRQQIHRYYYNLKAKLHLKSTTVGNLRYDF